MRTMVLFALVVTGGLVSGLSAPAHGDDSDALVNVAVADNQLVLLSASPSRSPPTCAAWTSMPSRPR
jgi:hypothetical protein